MEGTDETTENLVNQFFTDANNVFTSGVGGEYASTEQLVQFDQTKQQLQQAISTGDEVAQPTLLVQGLKQAAAILVNVPEAKLTGFTQIDKTMQRLSEKAIDPSLKQALYDFRNVYDSINSTPPEYGIGEKAESVKSDTKTNVPLDSNIQDLLALARAHENFALLSYNKKKGPSNVFNDFAANAGEAAMKGGNKLTKKMSADFNNYIKQKADVNSSSSVEQTTYGAMMNNIKNVIGLGSHDDILLRIAQHDKHGDALPMTVRYLKSMEPYARGDRDLSNLLVSLEANAFSHLGSKMNPQPRVPRPKPGDVEEIKESSLATLRTDSNYVHDYIDLSSVKNVSDSMKPDIVMGQKNSNMTYENKMLNMLGKKRNRKLNGMITEIIDNDYTRKKFPTLVEALDKENSNLEKLRVGKKFVGMLTNAADRSSKYEQGLIKVKKTIDELSGDLANTAPEREEELEVKRQEFYQKSLELDQKEEYLNQVSKQINDLKGKRLIDQSQREFKLALLDSSAVDPFSKNIIAEIKTQLASNNPDFYTAQNEIAKEQVSIKQQMTQLSEGTTQIQSQLNGMQQLRNRQDFVQGDYEDKRAQIDKYLGDNGYSE